jgi:enamine deaminase RidA (YjgF/YER057c/UK114 family)
VGVRQLIDRQRYNSESPYESKVAFSRAIRVGNRIIVSGTAPFWPDGTFHDDAEMQARRCYEIILDALREFGADARHIVSTRLYITDAGDFQGVVNAQNAILGETRPAATMIVSKLLDPRWRVEIEAEAVM